MRPIIVALLLTTLLLAAGPMGGMGHGAQANPVNLAQAVAKLKNVSPETRTCLGCHVQYTPGIVADWLRSKMAHMTPSNGVEKARTG